MLIGEACPNMCKSFLIHRPLSCRGSATKTRCSVLQRGGGLVVLVRFRFKPEKVCMNP